MHIWRLYDATSIATKNIYLELGNLTWANIQNNRNKMINLYPYISAFYFNCLHGLVRKVANVGNVANDTLPSLADPAELILASLKWVRNLA